MMKTASEFAEDIYDALVVERPATLTGGWERGTQERLAAIIEDDRAAAVAEAMATKDSPRQLSKGAG